MSVQTEFITEHISMEGNATASVLSTLTFKPSDIDLLHVHES